MSTSYEAPSAQRDLDPSHATERQPAGVGHDGAAQASGFLQGAFGDVIGNPILRHPSASGVRAAVMRRTQQHLGNRAAQKMVTQSERPPESEKEIKLTGAPVTGAVTPSVAAPGAAAPDAKSQAEPTAAPTPIAPSRGEPLPGGPRKRMESRIGHDFGDVRVHTDTPAAEMSSALDADAFTSGRDIYFARGQYNPDTRDGQRLLAHELTHVVQQKATPAPAMPPPAEAVVSSPEDPQEVEAESVSNAVMTDDPNASEERTELEEPKKPGEPETADKATSGEKRPRESNLGNLITPARAGVIHRQPPQKRPPMAFPAETVIVSGPDIQLFEGIDLFKRHWDLVKPTFVPLAGGTFIVDGIPITYSLAGNYSATSNAMAATGPGTLEHLRIIVTGAEAERLRRPRLVPNPLFLLEPLFGGPPVIVLPPDPEPHGSFSADAMLRFSALAHGDVNANADLQGKVGVFGALNAGAFAGLSGRASADVWTNVDAFVEFQWNDGAISLSTTLDITAALNLAFKLTAFAGVFVELRVPEIPVVTDLTHEVQSWPIIGWFVPDLTHYKWRKEYRKDWPLLDKNYEWQLQERFVIGSGSAAGALTNPEGLSLDSLLAELQGKQKDGDLKDDPEGPGRERRDSDTGAVSAAKAGALAQISSAKHAADREKKANTRLLAGARKAKAAAAKASSTGSGTPALAAITTTSDPVTDLEKREEKLNDAVASTEQLRKRVDALNAPATAPDGVSRNEARAGLDAVAKNADTLGDKIDNNEDAFAVPAATEPAAATDKADYESMVAARKKASKAFDDCFDVVRTEKLYADDQVDAAGTDVDLHKYRDAAVAYQGRALNLWNRVQKLEGDIEKAREWYETRDYALGAKVFDELESKAIWIKDDGDALKKDRPVGDWDTDYVELSAGHLQLKPEYRGKATRREFYPHDYSAATQNRMLIVIGSFHTGADGKIYWEYRHKKSPRGDFLWLMDDEKEMPTLDHTAPTVLAHWNYHGGRTTPYPPRKSFYDFEGASLVVVPKTLNSSSGGRDPDSYTPFVTRTFRGAK